MKGLKKSLALITAIGVMSLGATSFAGTQTGKLYSEAAKTSTDPVAIKAFVLKAKEDILKKKVEAGTMTQDQANKIIEAVKAAQASCDGTGSQAIGKSLGAAFGKADGKGQNNGQGQGKGQGNKTGEKKMLKDGTGFNKGGKRMNAGNGTGAKTGQGNNANCTVAQPAQ